MTVIYHDEDGDLNFLAGKQISIIGYGNMGRPMALNLRDSGASVLVSEPRPEKQLEAVAEGFTLTAILKLYRQQM
jgi:ketol-acid reductoisomerase